MTDRKLKISGLLLVVWFCAVAESAAEEPQQPRAPEASQLARDPCLQDNTCRDLYDGARRLSQAEQYDGALVMYQSAYSLQPRPWLLVNIGRMQQKLGRPEQAIVSYKRFLADPSSATDAAFLAKAQAYLDAAEHEVAEQQAKLHPTAVPVVAPAPVAPPKQPVYKKWWLWTAVGGAVVLTAVGLGVGLSVASQPQVGVPPGVSAFYPTF